jgi:hypothetical protein
VEFPFTAPAAGKVDVVIEAACGACRHELTVEDEWGVSDSTTDQSAYLMMHVLHPDVAGPAFVKMSHFPCTTDHSTVRSHEFLARGTDYFASLTSEGAVPANETVVIRAGGRLDDATMTNDMAISSKSTFEWTIKRVHVRIAP